MTRIARSRKRRRRTFKNPVPFMRGLVIESLGVAALGFLYFTMQASTAAEKAANKAVIEPGLVSTATTSTVRSDSSAR